MLILRLELLNIIVRPFTDASQVILPLLTHNEALYKRQTCAQAGFTGDPVAGCNEGIVNCCGQYNPECQLPAGLDFATACQDGILACCYQNGGAGNGGGGGSLNPDPPTGSGSGYGPSGPGPHRK